MREGIEGGPADNLDLVRRDVDSRDLSPTRFSCSFPHLLALDLVLSLFAPHGKVLCDSDIETSVSVNRHNIISYLSPCLHTSFRVRWINAGFSKPPQHRPVFFRAIADQAGRLADLEAASAGFVPSA